MMQVLNVQNDSELQRSAEQTCVKSDTGKTKGFSHQKVLTDSVQAGNRKHKQLLIIPE